MAAITAETVKQFSVVKSIVIELGKGGSLGEQKRKCVWDVYE